MKALLIPLVSLVLGVAAGAGLGVVLAPPDGPTEAVTEGDGHGATKAEAKGDGHAPSASHASEDEHASDGAETAFAELNNQFVVPVVRDGAVRALVVLSITLEVKAGESGQVFSIEPKLRDAFLQVMFDHANIGGFDYAFTQAERLGVLRQGLREAAQRLLGPIVRDVLIVDIVRQEV